MLNLMQVCHMDYFDDTLRVFFWSLFGITDNNPFLLSGKKLLGCSPFLFCECKEINICICIYIMLLADAYIRNWQVSKTTVEWVNVKCGII